MWLNTLSPAKKSRFSKKRVGRGDGSGLGRTSGRGEKGQKSRSGGGSRLGFEGGQMPLIRRLPKRGFFNFASKRYAILNLKDLACFENNAKVTLDILEQKGLIRSLKDPVKILSDGDLNVALTIRVNACSNLARKKIEQAGGKVEII